jgi:hypothetical protein
MPSGQLKSRFDGANPQLVTARSSAGDPSQRFRVPQLEHSRDCSGHQRIHQSNRMRYNREDSTTTNRTLVEDRLPAPAPLRGRGSLPKPPWKHS